MWGWSGGTGSYNYSAGTGTYSSSGSVSQAISTVAKYNKVKAVDYESAKELAAKEAAKVEVDKLKKKKGFRSTILTGPLGATDTFLTSKTMLG
jgi:hypothetical protein